MVAHSFHPSRSIRVRLGVVFALFSAAVAMALTGLLGQLGRTENEKHVRSQLEHSAAELARTISLGHYERCTELEAIAQLLEHITRKDPASRRATLEQFQNTGGRYRWIGLLNDKGVVTAATGGVLVGQDFSTDPGFQNGRTAPFFGRVELASALQGIVPSPNGSPEPLFEISVPVLDSAGHPTGVLCGYLGWQWLAGRYKDLSRTLERERLLEVLVVDEKERVLLAPPASGLEWQNFSVSELTDPERQSGDFLYGVAECRGFHDLQGPLWKVVLRQPSQVAFEPIQKLQANLFLGGLAGAMLAGIAGYWMAGIFTKPVTQLAQAARQISDGGSISAWLPPAAEDEIGVLTASLRGLFETRERNAQELRQTFRQFSSLFNNAAVGIAQISLDFHWVRVNARLAEILGYSADELRTKTFADVTHPDDLAEDMGHVRELLENRTSTYNMEKRYIRGDGQLIWGLLTVTLVRDEEGKPDHFVSVVEDITARKAAEAATRESEARFREMANHSPVLIWTFDPDRKCTWVNRPWLTFTGRSMEEELGDGWLTALHPEDRTKLAPLVDAVSTRKPFQLQHRLRRDDGAYRWFLAQGVPLYRGGLFIGYVGSSSDITESREAAEQQRIAREQAESANRAKDEFLAALSHELRTPLNPVLLLASDNEKAPHLPAEVRQDFAVIHENIALEARLIDDLLDLTRITRGKLQLALARANAHHLLQHAIAMVESNVAAKEIRLHLDLAAEEQDIRCDAVRLQQIFWNVILNAVKFTPEKGSIEIRSRTVEGKIVVEVKDSGFGIEPGEMAHIFEKFGQGAHTVNPHRFGGLGLGLSIAKVLVEAQEGRIWAESAGRGHGASFFIELPLLPAQSGGIAPTVLPQEVEATVSRRILLVEDHEPTRTTMLKLLKRRGHDVLAAEDIASAKNLAASSSFDLVISDLGLPDGTGHELMTELHDMYGLSGIALSGYGMDYDIQRSVTAGFRAHLIKPVGVDVLVDAIAQVSGEPDGALPAPSQE